MARGRAGGSGGGGSGRRVGDRQAGWCVGSEGCGCRAWARVSVCGAAVRCAGIEVCGAALQGSVHMGRRIGSQRKEKEERKRRK